MRAETAGLRKEFEEFRVETREGFKRVDEKIDTLRLETNQRLDRTDARLDKLYERMDDFSELRGEVRAVLSFLLPFAADKQASPSSNPGQRVLKSKEPPATEVAGEDVPDSGSVTQSLRVESPDESNGPPEATPRDAQLQNLPSLQPTPAS